MLHITGEQHAEMLETNKADVELIRYVENSGGVCAFALEVFHSLSLSLPLIEDSDVHLYRFPPTIFVTFRRGQAPPPSRNFTPTSLPPG